jgi:HD-GYP domain-containing protein (c-di-GMP phosphodiesterase class II)
VLKKISVAQVRVGMYIQAFDGSWMDHSFWKTRFVVDDNATLARVHNCGATQCWIDTSLGGDVAASPAAVVAPQPTHKAAPAAAPATSMADELRRATVIREQSRVVVTAMMQEARMGKCVDTRQCLPLVNEVVDSITRNGDALITLSRLKLADEYTYLHSVAVCALMVSLGRQLGFSDDQCREVGLAGLLHDLGKAAMPMDIINKPGKLTDAEFAIIKQHPEKGHQLLLEAGMQNASVLDVCLHHHEKMEGTGYPHQLDNSNLTLVARMGAVCDVYDAVTSNRPYKAGWDPAESVARMATWQGHFDTEILHAFIKSIGIYPTGSLVRLTSGRLAIVIAQTANKLTEPKVKVFFSTNSGMPLKPEVLDLHDRSCSEKIVGREAPEKWPFKNLNELWAGDNEMALALDAQHAKP